MTYKQIEAIRETRLWIGQVIIPAIGMSAALLTNPSIRCAAAQKVDDIKQRFRNRKIRVAK